MIGHTLLVLGCLVMVVFVVLVLVAHVCADGARHREEEDDDPDTAA